MYRNMPVDLVLVRHGESEGNLAQKLAKTGDSSQWSQHFRDRHNSLYRLTDRGRLQARVAGEYLRRHISPQFDRYFTSEYVRAIETAAMLDLPQARWMTEMYLRERDRGLLAGMTKEEREAAHPHAMNRAKRDALYWQPPGGESIANLCLRIDRVIDAMRENCSGLRVIIVCHGGVIKAFRALIERVKQRERADVVGEEGEGKFWNKIHNGQIVWYTRRDPVNGYICSKYNWVKSVCPWDLSRSSNFWRTLRRPVYTNEDLLLSVQQVPQLVNLPMRPADVMELSNVDGGAGASLWWGSAAAGHGGGMHGLGADEDDEAASDDAEDEGAALDYFAHPAEAVAAAAASEEQQRQREGSLGLGGQRVAFDQEEEEEEDEEDARQRVGGRKPSSLETTGEMGTPVSLVANSHHQQAEQEGERQAGGGLASARFVNSQSSPCFLPPSDVLSSESIRGMAGNGIAPAGGRGGRGRRGVGGGAASVPRGGSSRMMTTSYSFYQTPPPSRPSWKSQSQSPPRRGWNATATDDAQHHPRPVLRPKGQGGDVCDPSEFEVHPALPATAAHEIQSLEGKKEKKEKEEDEEIMFLPPELARMMQTQMHGGVFVRSHQAHLYPHHAVAAASGHPRELPSKTVSASSMHGGRGVTQREGQIPPTRLAAESEPTDAVPTCKSADVMGEQRIPTQGATTGYRNQGIGLSVTVPPPAAQYNTVVPPYATAPFIPVPAHLHIGGVSQAPSDSNASSPTPSPLPFASASPTQAFEKEGVMIVGGGAVRSRAPAEVRPVNDAAAEGPIGTATGGSVERDRDREVRQGSLGGPPAGPKDASGSRKVVVPPRAGLKERGLQEVGVKRESSLPNSGTEGVGGSGGESRSRTQKVPAAFHLMHASSSSGLGGSGAGSRESPPSASPFGSIPLRVGSGLLRNEETERERETGLEARGGDGGALVSAEAETVQKRRLSYANAEGGDSSVRERGERVGDVVAHGILSPQRKTDTGVRARRGSRNEDLAESLSLLQAVVQQDRERGVSGGGSGVPAVNQEARSRSFSLDLHSQALENGGVAGRRGEEAEGAGRGGVGGTQRGQGGRERASNTSGPNGRLPPPTAHQRGRGGEESSPRSEYDAAQGARARAGLDAGPSVSTRERVGTVDAGEIGQQVGKKGQSQQRRGSQGAGGTEGQSMPSKANGHLEKGPSASASGSDSMGMAVLPFEGSSSSSLDPLSSSPTIRLSPGGRPSLQNVSLHQRGGGGSLSAVSANSSGPAVHGVGASRQIKASIDAARRLGSGRMSDDDESVESAEGGHGGR
uniref:phosphoglycerate mutase (2,3-diphosphoglycerate-dependent) n=1 Tax=Chromera velia CCMP2878 TaxID=1169474 RepID=A0A0G4I7I0_9ALVE|eukprot:Cvel_1945.t1-p1 / transcript=Cvel_1945.t1 / gene=Cvel_1945 / organism=Chromera_velia_CCMP2878 / gene_product=2,3-bisphosphoglycerate-dependent phosphoglycerate, putative / transcript_product=2,3-bisphosphoglycerate-dependent phosphoglycerate, putative / location=Cvel_scaffold73:122698-130271(+) / protein_length=1294 / sequence_SO=supercontig / SO=protein_coding / is_pseudo=false